MEEESRTNRWTEQPLAKAFAEALWPSRATLSAGICWLSAAVGQLIVRHKTRAMGFSLSWAAVKGSTPAVVLETLALRGSGVTEDNPESEITGAELPGGWYLVVSQ